MLKKNASMGGGPGVSGCLKRKVQHRDGLAMKKLIFAVLVFRDDPQMMIPGQARPGHLKEFLPLTKDANGMDSVTFNIYLHPL